MKENYLNNILVIFSIIIYFLSFSTEKKEESIEFQSQEHLSQQQSFSSPGNSVSITDSNSSYESSQRRMTFVESNLENNIIDNSISNSNANDNSIYDNSSNLNINQNTIKYEQNNISNNEIDNENNIEKKSNNEKNSSSSENLVIRGDINFANDQDNKNQTYNIQQEKYKNINQIQTLNNGYSSGESDFESKELSESRSQLDINYRTNKSGIRDIQIENSSSIKIQSSRRGNNPFQSSSTQKIIFLGQQDVDWSKFEGQISDLNDNVSQSEINNNKGRQNHSEFDDDLWRSRLNGIPMAIGLVEQKKFSLIYVNDYFSNFFQKVLQVQPGIEQDFLLNQLQFRIIDHGHPNYVNKKLQNLKNNFNFNKNSVKGSSISGNDIGCVIIGRKKRVDTKPKRFYDASIKNKFFCIYEILLKLNSNVFSQYINKDDQTLELYCSYKSLNLNCKIVTEKNVDFMIILQDLSKQNYYQQVEKQNQFKTKMINSFSHELRTPLNSAYLFMKTCMMDEQVGLTTKSDYILPCISSLQRQTILINDIIDFSQINAGLFDVEYSEFMIQEIVDELKEHFYFEYKMKQIGLAFNIEKGVPSLIKSDKQRLIQILVNLLQNAQKFSTQGYVYIQITAKNDKVIEFTIQDEGCGIVKEKLFLVQSYLAQFDKNSEEYNNQSDDWEGFGLIISQMILRHIAPFKKTKLSIYSKGLGQGCIVNFKIFNYLCIREYSIKNSHQRVQLQPFLRSETNLKLSQGLMISICSKTKSNLIFQDMIQVQNKDEFNIDDDNYIGYLERLMDNIPNMSRNNTNQLTSTQFPQEFPIQCTCTEILSVDDEIFNQTALRGLLKKLGFYVEVAYNGQQAIEKLLAKPQCCDVCKKYVLILMDCQMPIMDGWETTRQMVKMMSINQIFEIPIIGLTAFNNNKDIQECFNAGMKEVLSKPLNILKFKEILRFYGIRQPSQQ